MINPKGLDKNFLFQNRSRSGVVILAIIFHIFFPAAHANYNSKVGPGGVAVTPRGISFKNRPEYRTSESSFTVSETKLDMKLDDAKKILASTNLVTGATLGDGSEISQQSMAFASILYYANKSTANFAFMEIFNSAQHVEGRVYGLMGVYFFGGKSALEEGLKHVKISDELNVLIRSKLYHVSVEEFFKTFLKDTSIFFPKEDVLHRGKIIEINDVPPPVYISRPPVIITPKPPAPPKK